MLATSGLPAVSTGAPVQAPMPGPIVGVEWLASNREAPDLVILHAARDRAGYDTAHVPRARFVGLPAFAPTVRGIAAELLSADSAAGLLAALGVSNTSRVVIYGDLPTAARLWFTLDWLGHGDRAAVLDGGLDAWRAAGRAVTAEVPSVTRGRFVPDLHAEAVVTAVWLRGRLGGPDLRLLDARTPEEFDGTQADDELPRSGHLPGAVNLDWRRTVEGGRFLPVAELRRLFEAAGVRSGEEVVTYCRSGTRSSVLHLLARALGYRARMYDGSILEWARRTDLPLVRPP